MQSGTVKASMILIVAILAFDIFIGANILLMLI